MLFSVAEYIGATSWRAYDVAPDGSRFVMIRETEEPRDELVVVEYFFTELQAKVRR